MEKRTNEKKVLFLSFLGVITFIVVVVGATYAYFQAQGGTGANTNVNVTTNTTDNLSFQVGNAINITASEEDFASGMGNKSGSTFARATLTANNATNNATRNYYIYLNITNNDFEYTNGDTAELLLKVTSPTGEVTTLSGLDRKTSGSGNNEVTGFDITTKTGLLTLADNYEIIASPNKIDEWTIEVIFVNLDSDQNANTGKTFNAELIIQEETMEINYLADYIVNEVYTTNGENGLYYHDNNLAEGAGDNSYRYSGGDYKVASNYAGTYTKIYDEIIKLNCNGSEQLIGESSCAVDNFYYTLAYDSNNTQYATMLEALNQAVVDGYITENNIKNYVCFGSDEDICPLENLYRIIGVFDDGTGEYQIKLIKADYATTEQLSTEGDFDEVSTLADLWSPIYRGSTNKTIATYFWNNVNYGEPYTEGVYRNAWVNTELNNTNLNGYYLNTYIAGLGKKWSDMIIDSTWYFSDMSTADVKTMTTRYNAKTIYDYDLGDAGLITATPFEPLTAKVGLMYVSEFIYSANPMYWGELDLTSVDLALALTENWMDIGSNDWTMSRVADNALKNRVFTTGSSVMMLDYMVNTNNGIRPTFKISHDVRLVSGTGTQTDPYRLAL